MLYVFHVEGGQMTTYDMNLTLQSVAHLKDAIECKTKIPSGSMVLLVSGGDVLHPDHMVSSYSAGTDTNPIYLFCKPSVKDSLSSHPEEEMYMKSTLDGKSLADLRANVEHCCTLPPAMSTVTACASLAQQFKEQARLVSQNSEQLVHEQHLQHQGWAAVVANLDDIFNEFCERSCNFKDSFRKHRLKKDEYRQHLNALNEVLESLGKIPILPSLRLNAEEHRFSAFDVFEEVDFEGNYYKVPETLYSAEKGQDFGLENLKLSEEDVFGKDASTSKDASSGDKVQLMEQSDGGIEFKANLFENKEDPTLLHWILAQGNKASLQDIVDYCQKGLTLIDEEPLKEQEAALCNLLEYANVNGLKHIKGIEDRLFGLDQLMNQAKKLERDQHDQATSLIQCRDRLNSACDPSVLPTLVQSHCCQLEKLLKGHQELVSIRRRISNSKEELSKILKARLETVLVIENSMSVQDAHAMLSFQCFNRLARYFEIVAQLHRAPAVFIRAVHEVARRRTFSQAYLAWAMDIAQKLVKIHEEEVSRRDEFNSIFQGHFLKSLFPGMGDAPTAFATVAPPVFDAALPQLCAADVRRVADAFPQLAEHLPQYEMDFIVRFFDQRMNTFDMKGDDLADVDKDNESELETGDFEKLSAQLEKQKMDMSTSCAPETMAVSTVTEVRTVEVSEREELRGCDEFEHSEFYIEESLPSSLEWGRERQENMNTHKINMDKLQEFLVTLCGLCRANVNLIREEVSKLKNELNEQRELIRCKYLEILDAWNKSVEDNDTKFREQTQRLTLEHELELSDLKAVLQRKEEVIELMKKSIEDLKAEHQKALNKQDMEHQTTKELLLKAREEIKAIEMKVLQFNEQKEKDIKDMQDKMHLDYKAEIESLRSRYRLVALTSMDRSPSESSLEKIERTDMIEISSHNAIVLHTKETAELEREEAVRAAQLACEALSSKRLNDEIAALKAKYDAEKQVSINEVTRRLLTEKDRQLEAARDREGALARECAKYRETLHQLTDADTNDYEGPLKTQLSLVESEKSALVQQLENLKKELAKKEEALKNKEEDSEGRWSPKREERRRARSHTPVGLGAGTLSLAACMPGRTVLLMWDPSHHNYTLLQESQIMYFVHSDSLPALGLSINVKNESERKLYAVGVVESKDFCYAKKSGNRYNMPNASRFYRVRVRPARPALPAPPCCEPRHHADVLKSGVLSVLGEKRPLKKWLTYMHAPEVLRSVDTSQSTSSATDEASRVAEVVTGTLINLESPVSTSEAASTSTMNISEDQLDSIETSEQWQTSRMQMSAVTIIAEMECSVGQCGETSDPLEVSAVCPPAPPAPACDLPELAEEAEP